MCTGNKVCLKIQAKLNKYIKIEDYDKDVFLLDLFNMYSKMILRRLEDLSKFMINWHHLNMLLHGTDSQKEIFPPQSLQSWPLQ